MAKYITKEGQLNKDIKRLPNTVCQINCLNFSTGPISGLLIIFLKDTVGFIKKGVSHQLNAMPTKNMFTAHAMGWKGPKSIMMVANMPIPMPNLKVLNMVVKSFLAMSLVRGLKVNTPKPSVPCFTWRKCSGTNDV